MSVGLIVLLKFYSVAYEKGTARADPETIRPRMGRLFGPDRFNGEEPMKRVALCVGATLLAATPVLAQTATTPPAASVPSAGTVQGGSPAAATSGPGSAGYVSPTGRAEDRVS